MYNLIIEGSEPVLRNLAFETARCVSALYHSTKERSKEIATQGRWGLLYDREILFNILLALGLPQSTDKQLNGIVSVYKQACKEAKFTGNKKLYPYSTGSHMDFPIEDFEVDGDRLSITTKTGVYVYNTKHDIYVPQTGRRPSRYWIIGKLDAYALVAKHDIITETFPVVLDNWE